MPASSFSTRLDHTTSSIATGWCCCPLSRGASGPPVASSSCRLSPEEVERVVGAISANDVMDFAKRKLWDRDIAVSAVGQIEGLFDYARIRGDMTRMLS